MHEFFSDLAQHQPRWNFIFFYDHTQAGRILDGTVMTIKLAVACIVFSVLIGLVGAFLQTSRLTVLRYLTHGYIQLFRNTPPMVQLLFFYFALGSLTPTFSPDGWTQIPIISSVGWAIISLSFFAGSFNVEIFRAGLEAVPYATREAASSLGMTGLQTYRYVTLPLAFRASLPALNNNLVNLVKTTTQAMVIAVPELFYQLVQIMSEFESAKYPAFILMFTVYVGLVSVLAAAMTRWEKVSRIPGYGN